MKKFWQKFRRRWFKMTIMREELIDNIRQLQTEKKKQQPGTPEYEALQNEINKEYDIYKKWKDSRRVSGEVKATLVVVGAIAFFAICLDQESPKALKLAQFIIKLFKFG